MSANADGPRDTASRNVDRIDYQETSFGQ